VPTLRRSESAACSHSGCDENPETAALVRGTLGFVAVMLHVCFGCLNGMVGCVVEMPLGAMGVVLGRLAMVLSCLLGHAFSPCHCGETLLAGEANGPVLQVCDSGVTGM
jgi:Fe-S-cluster-containing dehydrogenase component